MESFKSSNNNEKNSRFKTRASVRGQTPRVSIAQPLHLLNLLPPVDHQLAYLKPKLLWPGSRSPDAQEILLSRFALGIQHVLLETVLEVWWNVLEDGKEPEDLFGRALIWTWFSPSLVEGEGRFRTVLVLCGFQALGTRLSSISAASSSKEASRSSSRSSFKSNTSLSLILDFLQVMSISYPIPIVFNVLFPPSPHQSAGSNAKNVVIWEGYTKLLLNIPTKVMNATQGGTLVEVPKELDSNRWLGHIVLNIDRLVWEASSTGRYSPSALEDQLAPILSGLLRQGFLGLSSSLNPRQPAQTLFSHLLPILLPRVIASSSPSVEYCKTYRKLFQALPFSDLARAAESLLRHLLAGLNASSDNLNEASEIVRLGRASKVMGLVIGREEEGVWQKVLLGAEASSLGSERDIRQRAIVGIGWVGGESKNSDALEKFMSKVLELWTDVQFIKYSLVKKHIYVLTILLLAVRSFPIRSPQIIRLSFLPEFLQCLPHYLSHPDPTIRHLGMLSAEVISSRSTPSGDKVLNFGVWEGDEGGKRICRELRKVEIDWNQFTRANEGLETGSELDLLGWNQQAQSSSPPFESSRQPSPPASASRLRSQLDRETRSKIKKKKSTKVSSSKITVLSDSDDSLTGYASSSHSISSRISSRSSSPTPSDLDEYIDDPTLYAPKKKKVPKPVYLTQLGELLGSRDDPDKLEVGLKWGESLVRRKRDFGLELEENAEFIAVTLAGLNDNFELEDFENRKQGILNALVCCSPRKVAPALIEQYFHNQYSLHQRSAILTALAMGAREAASLPVLALPSVTSTDWPSKRLPNALHSKYISPSDPIRAIRSATSIRGGAVERIADELKDLAIERGREDAESNIESFQREKRLRVNPRSTKPLVQESLTDSNGSSRPKMRSPNEVSFTTVAAEFFILPMINRFWNHYQEQTTQSLRSSSSSTPSATGTGMILSPLSLSKFLATLMVLVHASRHSTLFLAVIAPEALQLAVTLGSRPLSSTLNKRGQVEDEEADEISVLGSSLDLALVTLDASRDLDAGQTLVTSHHGLVLAIAEWAELVFKRTESGERVSGEGGGEGGGKVRRSSAGVCVQVGEVRERWVRLTGF
ncbi:Uncharacterized conserved protein [Phaffia rhodozyma]|uniref:Uncharacterized conserved protein n=1 Tax=Phaffia rhodozyma TaxID=264483 RepID=A0A0F7SIR9_PHARH|nr:Uncharacterized conserved protein [Phaffia rhodozyma]